ncbi:hypothetical protein SETIT_3G034400v2 [Setaria italica]|uniref:Uncharacterized protein n=3 Tax=Setaria TaxID=4554 RepID=A0A368QAX5_SETIT|nr:hypothetical protein SETIT_3G034400v2 [Setaria italica]
MSSCVDGLHGPVTRSGGRKKKRHRCQVLQAPTREKLERWGVVLEVESHPSTLRNFRRDEAGRRRIRSRNLPTMAPPRMGRGHRRSQCRRTFQKVPHKGARCGVVDRRRLHHHQC